MHSLDQFLRIVYGCGFREKVEVGECVRMSLKPLKHPSVHLVAAAVHKVYAFYWLILTLKITECCCSVNLQEVCFSRI